MINIKFVNIYKWTYYTNCIIYIIQMQIGVIRTNYTRDIQDHVSFSGEWETCAYPWVILMILRMSWLSRVLLESGMLLSPRSCLHADLILPFSLWGLHPFPTPCPTMAPDTLLLLEALFHLFFCPTVPYACYANGRIAGGYIAQLSNSRGWSWGKVFPNEGTHEVYLTPHRLTTCCRIGSTGISRQ